MQKVMFYHFYSWWILMFWSSCFVFFCPWALMKMLENMGSVTNSLSDLSLSLAALSALWRTCIPYLSPQHTHGHTQTCTRAYTQTHIHKRKQLYASVITICFAFTQHIKWSCTVQEKKKSYQTMEIFDTPCADMLHLKYFHNAYFPRLPAEIK